MTLTNRDRAPFAYPGAKQDICDKLVKLFPKGGDWLEPFAGGASTTLWAIRENKCDSYWFNDRNFNVFTFWDRLQSEPVRLFELIEGIRVKYHPFEPKDSKILFDWSRTALLSRHTAPIDRAVWFYVNQQVSYAARGLMGGNSDTRSRRRFTERKVSLLPEFGKLLKGVRITNLDYADCFKQVGRRSNVYVDSPYDQPIKLYDQHESFDHDRMAEVVNQLRCNVVITYDANPNHFIRYPGWRFYERSMTQHLVNLTGNPKEQRRKTEFVLWNFATRHDPAWRPVRRFKQSESARIIPLFAASP